MATPAPSHHPSNSAPKKRRRAKRAVQYDDMDDSLEIAAIRGEEKLRPLCDALENVRKFILPEFQRADRLALDYRKKYQDLSFRAVTFGACAVIIGIAEFALQIKLWERLLELLEVGMAIACLYYICEGARRKLKDNWLAARYKAEHLRLLKFKTLLDPELWWGESQQRDGCEPVALTDFWSEVSLEVIELAKVDRKKVEALADKGVRPEVSEVQYPPSCDESLKELIHYYCDKRLHAQMRYLANKSEEEEKQDTAPQLWTQILFFISFTFVLIHLLLSFIGDPTELQSTLGALLSLPVRAWHGLLGLLELRGLYAFYGLVALLKHFWAFLHLPAPTEEFLSTEWFANLCLVIAAILPAIVAGLRSYRGSREFARNASRHRATLDSLEDLSDEMAKVKALAERLDRDEKVNVGVLAEQLVNDKLAKAKILERQLQIVRFCELILEFDTCEFVRLIREMEWYG
jgi:hypothetical protein